MSTTVVPSEKATAAELSLGSFLQTMEKNFPNEVIRVSHPVEPAKFEVSAILKHLENRGKFPLLVFENPKDTEGRPAAIPLLSNIYASRERCAVAMGLKPEQAGMELSLEYARRLQNPIAPVR